MFPASPFRRAALALSLSLLAPSFAGANPILRVASTEVPAVFQRLVAQDFALATDHLYRDSDHPSGFDVVPVFTADEVVRVLEVTSLEGSHSAVRVTVRLASTGETAFFEVANWAEVAHFLAPLPILG